MKQIVCLRCGARQDAGRMTYFGLSRGFVCDRCGCSHKPKRWVKLYDGIICAVLSIGLAFFVLWMTSRVIWFMVLYFALWIGLYVVANSMLLFCTGDLFCAKKTERRAESPQQKT